jgi:mRNA interferase MazF
MRRGEIWWADLGPAHGSSPAKRRPVLVVQSDSFNASRIGTVIAAVITSNQRLAAAPGNVAVSKRSSKLPRDSVVNVSQLVTLDKRALTSKVSAVAPDSMERVVAGIRLVLEL